MADIAFLLLIFFLVATTILNDKGILVRLPPMQPGEPTPLPERNVFTVKINAGNELLAEGQLMRASNLRALVQEFVLNPEGREDLASHPGKAVVSLQHDRGTLYGAYLEVYDELVGAYRDMWDEEARRTYNKPYEQLSFQAQRAIRKRLPMVISEAELTGWGQE